jgi:heme exporter protein CcmD
LSDIPHLGFIVAAYLVTAVAVLAMIGVIVIDYRHLTRALSRLDSKRNADDAR